MTIKQVKRAAKLRGIYFSGIKEWRNNTVGFAYEVYVGGKFFQADTLDGIYNEIMKYRKEF